MWYAAFTLLHKDLFGSTYCAKSISVKFSRYPATSRYTFNNICKIEHIDPIYSSYCLRSFICVVSDQVTHDQFKKSNVYSPKIEQVSVVHFVKTHRHRFVPCIERRVESRLCLWCIVYRRAKTESPCKSLKIQLHQSYGYVT